MHSVEDVMNLMTDVGRHYGLDQFVLSGMPLPGETMEPYMLLSGWDEGWLERYTSENYVFDDPIVQRMQQSVTPFAWSDVRFKRGEGSRAEKIMNEAGDFGLNDGFMIPVYSHNGFEAGLSYGAKNLELTYEDKTAIHLIGIYAHNKVREFKHRKTTCILPDVKSLSKREIECVRWAADGKTSWEISRILGISESTVNQYFKSASKKLGAATRAQLIAMALRLNLIT